MEFLAIVVALFFLVILVGKVTDVAVDGLIEGIFAAGKRIFATSSQTPSPPALSKDFDPHGLVTAPISFELAVPMEDAIAALTAAIKQTFPLSGPGLVQLRNREHEAGREILHFVGGTAEQPDSFTSELWLDGHTARTDVTYLVKEFTKLDGGIAAADVMRMMRNEIESASYRIDPARSIIVGKATF